LKQGGRALHPKREEKEGLVKIDYVREGRLNEGKKGEARQPVLDAKAEEGPAVLCFDPSTALGVTGLESQSRGVFRTRERMVFREKRKRFRGTGRIRR